MAQRSYPSSLPATLWDIDRTTLSSETWLPENVFSRAHRKVPTVEACPLRSIPPRRMVVTLSPARTIFPASIPAKHPTWTLSNWLDQRWFLVPDDRALSRDISREWTYIIAHYSRSFEYEQVVPELWAIAAIFEKYWPHYGMNARYCTVQEIRAIVDEMHSPIPRMSVASSVADSPADLMQSLSPDVRKIGHLRQFVDAFTAPLLERANRALAQSEAQKTE